MASPSTATEFLDICRKSGVLDEASLTGIGDLGPSPVTAAKALIRKGVLTKFQATQLLAGKHKGLRFDRLKILDRIGSGGMGTVFLCEHLGLRKQVAVKILPPDQAGDEGTRERFFREARAAAALDHPNIVRVFDTNSSGGVHYIVMEYVDGQDLQTMINKYGPMPYKRAVTYIAQAALGLQHAYEKNLVHRDIKPANLLVDKDGVVKILDMGLARFNTDVGDNLTAKYDKGAILGTADYMAPEQIVASSEVDIRADIYSLGATLYTLINGKPPFSGTSTQKLVGHQSHKATSLTQIRSEIPKGVSAVVERMMAKSSSERYHTPLEVVEALNPWLEADTMPIEAQQTRVLTNSGNRSRKILAEQKRNKTLKFAGIALSTLILGGIAVWLLSGNNNSPIDSQAIASNQPVRPASTLPNVTPTNNHTAKVETVQAPPAPVANKLLYEIDFSKHSAFEIKYVEGVRQPESGGAPKGWLGHFWSSDSSGEIRQETYRGIPCVSMKTLKGLGSAEWMTSGNSLDSIQLQSKKPYFARVEYAIVGLKAAQLEFRVGNLTEGGLNQISLPTTNGKFETIDCPFQEEAINRYCFLFKYWDAGAEDILYIKSFKLFEGDVPGIPSSEKSVYQWQPSIFEGLDVQCKQFTLSHLKRELPRGFHFSSWEQDSIAHLVYNASDKSLEVTNLQGRSAMILGPTVPVEAHQEYRISFEYKSPKAIGLVKVQEGGLQARHLCQLLQTENWRTHSLRLRMSDVTTARFEFHNYTANAQVFCIRNINVYKVDPTQESSLYSVGFDSNEAFDRTLSTTVWTSPLISNWSANCWNEGDSGVIASTTHQGSKCILIKNAENSQSNSIQIFLIDSKIPAQVGQRFKVRIAYALPSGNGSLELRHGGDPNNSMGRLSLEQTGGAWRTKELEFNAREQSGISFFLQNSIPGNVPMYIKSIQLDSLGVPNQRSQYRLDTDQLKSFARRLRGDAVIESHGDGDLKKPWVARVANETSEADVFADEYSGSLAYGFRNHVGRNALQLSTNQPVIDMVQGKQYSLKIRYARETNARPVISVHGPGGLDQRFELQGSAERWVDAEFTILAKSNGPMQLQLNNDSQGSDSSAYIKMIEIREL